MIVDTAVDGERCQMMAEVVTCNILLQGTIIIKIEIIEAL